MKKNVYVASTIVLLSMGLVRGTATESTPVPSIETLHQLKTDADRQQGAFLEEIKATTFAHDILKQQFDLWFAAVRNQMDRIKAQLAQQADDLLASKNLTGDLKDIEAMRIKIAWFTRYYDTINRTLIPLEQQVLKLFQQMDSILAGLPEKFNDIFTEKTEQPTPLIASPIPYVAETKEKQKKKKEKKKDKKKKQKEVSTTSVEQEQFDTEEDEEGDETESYGVEAADLGLISPASTTEETPKTKKEKKKDKKKKKKEKPGVIAKVPPTESLQEGT